MNIILYNTSSNKLKLDKALTGALTKTIQVKGTIDILDPVITIAYDVNALTKNYAYIETFGRYYVYKKAPDVLPGQSITLYLHVDVRKTYQAQIKASTARVTRSQSNYDTMIPDQLIINKVATKITQRKIGTAFTRANKYHVMIGG